MKTSTLCSLAVFVASLAFAGCASTNPHVTEPNPAVPYGTQNATPENQPAAGEGGTSGSASRATTNLQSQKQQILDQLFQNYDGMFAAPSTSAQNPTQPPSEPGEEAQQNREQRQENESGTSGNVQRDVEKLGHDVSHGVKQQVNQWEKQIDRAAFEQDCEEVGRGERPIWGGEQTKQFFAQNDVRQKCADVARLSEEIKARGGNP